MFECTNLETIKRNLNSGSLKRVAGFHEPSSLKEFITSASEEIKERIFSITNPSIFFELLNPLIELNCLYMPEKLPDSPILISKLKETTDSQRVPIVTMQSLIMLLDVIDDPVLRSMLSCFVFLEKKKKNITRTTLNNLNQSCLNSKNAIADPDYVFKSYDKVLKVLSHSYLDVFENYQKLLSNFAKGFKSVCKKQSEETLFFEMANYFANSFQNQLTMEEIFLNKIYASILSFGYILENRIIRAFEKSKLTLKGRNQVTVEEAKSKETRRDKIHVGKLSFRIVQNDFEVNEYESFLDEIETSDQMKLLESLLEDEEEAQVKEGDHVRNLAYLEKLDLKMKLISKLSDSLSVRSTSTSESSVDSENLKGKRRHRKRRSRRNKRKNLLKQTPEEYLNHPNSWNFQNWVYGISWK